MDAGSAFPENEAMLLFEQQARTLGYLAIAGVDEVGRGPLAGPVVATAVILPESEPVPVGVTDSKALTAAMRERLCREIQELPGVRIGIAELSAEVVDQMNILRATHQAMRLALKQLTPPCDYILVDGLPVPDLPAPSKALVKGDRRSASIAAASIVAKVYRDRQMVEMDSLYPGYGFAQHKGYGTRAHLEALNRLGPCHLHRRSFAPVARLLAPASGQLELKFSD
jgi:ribonuclease HII